MTEFSVTFPLPPPHPHHQRHHVHGPPRDPPLCIDRPTPAIHLVDHPHYHPPHPSLSSSRSSSSSSSLLLLLLIRSRCCPAALRGWR
eukprot:9480420-Pyramimonas_sp.AAC.1